MVNRFVQTVGLASVMRGFNDLLDQMDGDVVYLTGSSADYAIHLEFGTSKMQAYPWLRPAVDEFKSNPSRFLKRRANTSIDDVDSAGQMVGLIALGLERAMTENVSADRGGDRSPGVHPDHPKRVSGNLAGSIEAVKVR